MAVKRVPANTTDLECFLRDDLLDALKGLFVGTVTWHAYPEQEDQRYYRGLGMFAALVQARALYEFYFTKNGDLTIGGTASARHFAPSWRAIDEDGLYERYMAREQPAQKRIFHLVYGRPGYSGGLGVNSDYELKNQILRFASDLRRLTTDFIGALQPPYSVLAETALRDALRDAKILTDEYGITVQELTEDDHQPARTAGDMPPGQTFI